MKASEIIELWIDRVWEQEDASAIDEMLIADTKALGLDQVERVGPEEFKAFHACLLNLITDMKFKILRQNEEDDGWVSTLFELTAKSRATGEPVTTTGHMYSHVVDDMILQGHNHVDFIRLFEQLDLLPANSFGTCLQGEKVV